MGVFSRLIPVIACVDFTSTESAFNFSLYQLDLLIPLTRKIIPVRVMAPSATITMVLAVWCMPLIRDMESSFPATSPATCFWVCIFISVAADTVSRDFLSVPTFLLFYDRTEIFIYSQCVLLRDLLVGHGHVVVFFKQLLYRCIALLHFDRVYNHVEDKLGTVGLCGIPQRRPYFVGVKFVTQQAFIGEDRQSCFDLILVGRSQGDILEGSCPFVGRYSLRVSRRIRRSDRAADEFDRSEKNRRAEHGRHLRGHAGPVDRLQV